MEFNKAQIEKLIIEPFNYKILITVTMICVLPVLLRPSNLILLFAVFVWVLFPIDFYMRRKNERVIIRMLKYAIESKESIIAYPTVNQRYNINVEGYPKSTKVSKVQLEKIEALLPVTIKA